MQVVIAALLIFLALTAHGQNCSKYDRAMQDGKKYLADKSYDKALVEFQAAQIAARECGLNTTEPAAQLDKVFKGLQRQKDNAVKARQQAEREKQISKRTLGYFFKSDSAAAAWGFDLTSGKYGVMDRDGRLLGDGFVWESTTPFKGDLAIAKRNDTMYFVNKSGDVISKGYQDFVQTEFPLYYFGQRLGSGRDIVFFNGRRIETLGDAAFDVSINNTRLAIFPFRVGKKFGFTDKQNNHFRPSVYDEIRIPNGVQQYAVLAASKDSLWDLIDLTNAKLLAAGLSLTQLAHFIDIGPIKELIDTDKSVTWVPIFKNEPAYSTEFSPLDFEPDSASISRLDSTLENHIDTFLIELRYRSLLNNYDSVLNAYSLQLSRLGGQIDSAALMASDSNVTYDEVSSIFKMLKDGYQVDTHYGVYHPEYSLNIKSDTASMIYRYNSLLRNFNELLYKESKLLSASILFRKQAAGPINPDSAGISANYPTFGQEDTSFLPNARFTKFITATGSGLTSAGHKIVLPPVYDIVRYVIGDSIFLVGNREITKKDTSSFQVGMPAYDTSYVCRFFNASTGLFSYKSQVADIDDFWKGIIFNGPSDTKEPPRYDYSMYFMNTGKAIPWFDSKKWLMEMTNRDAGIQETRKFSDETAILSLDGYVLNNRNEVDSLGYCYGCRDGIYKNENYDAGKKGLLKADGSLLTPPLFDEILDPAEGLRKARIKDKYGFIDSTGWLLPFEFENAYSFHDGRACVEKNGKYGFIDHSGRTVISFSYDDLQYGQFYEGLIGAKKGTKWGFIDKDEKWMINPAFDSVNAFTDGVCPVMENGKWGYIDKMGNILYPFTLEDAKSSSDYKNGWARIKANGKWGFFNVMSQRKIEPVYDSVIYFVGNYAWTGNKDAWTILDTMGRPIRQFIHVKRVFPYDNGCTWIQTSEGVGLLDSVGNVLVPIDPKNTVYGYDNEGRIYTGNDTTDRAKILEIKKDRSIEWKTVRKYPDLDFQNGLLATSQRITNREGEVLLEGHYNPQQIACRTYKLGYGKKVGYAAFTDYGTGVDDPEKPVKLIRFLPLQYEQIGFPLNEEYMPVKKNGKWGFIRWVPQHDGTESPYLAIPCIYDAVVPFITIRNEKIAAVSKNGAVYFINEKGEALIQ